MSVRQRIRRQQILQHAEGYLELGMADHALTMLERLGLAAADSRALYLHGEALRALERWSDAVERFHQAAELDPEDYHTWLALGWCYKRLGRIDLAIESLESALAVNGDEAIIHYNLACYWSLGGNKRQALCFLAQAFQIDPDYRDLVPNETDFDALRDDPDFQTLTSMVV